MSPGSFSTPDITRVFISFFFVVQNFISWLAKSSIFGFTQSRTKPASTIIVYRTSRLGDFVVALPALAILRERFPNARIMLVTIVSTIKKMDSAAKKYATGINGPPWLSFVNGSLVDRSYELRFHSFAMAVRQMRVISRRIRPDSIFLLPFSAEGLISRLKKMIFLRLGGFTGRLYGWRIHSTMSMLREAQNRLGRFEHQIWGPLRAVMECPDIGRIRPADIRFPISVSASDGALVDQIIAKKNWQSNELVAVFPGGTFEHKKWPIERFEEIVAALLERHPSYRFLIVGLSSDAALAKRLCAVGGERCLDLCGKLSITALAAVFKRCRLFIGNDSGPTHLAAATGCRCVSIISQIDYPVFWDPYGSDEFSVRHDVPCRQCRSYTHCPLGTAECIKGITVARVAEACAHALR